MTEHHKEGSSNFAQTFWAVFIFLCLWGVMMAILTDVKRSYEPVEIEELPPALPTTTEPPNEEYHRMWAEGDHAKNTCTFKDDTYFNDTIKVIYPDEIREDKVIGTWQSASNTISLYQPRGLNLSTVAHEVAHMVETFKEKRPDLDNHFYVYMQGYFTECVYSIMYTDHLQAQNGKFKHSTDLTRIKGTEL